MRTLLIFAVLASTAQAEQFLPALAVAIAVAETEGGSSPAPAPTPSPGGRCDNCDGTGRLGDGTVSVPCPVCGGDGKIDSQPAAPVAPCDAISGILKKQREAAEFPPQAAGPSPEGHPPAVFSERDLPADQQPTPLAAVIAALDALPQALNKPFYDLGCGPDARVLIKAVQRNGFKRAIGIEIDPGAAESARREVERVGLSHRITIITGDATKTPIEQGAIGFAYQFEGTLVKFRPQIVARFDAFATYSHPVPGLTMTVNRTYSDGPVYVWRRPQPQPTVLNYRPKQTATWRGRQYTGPVCNRPGCSMCNAIRSQLWNR